MMVEWYFPTPFDFERVQDFFTTFINKNVENHTFSYRIFANLTSWPLSYLNDLIKQRRNLTIIRAIEFAHFAKYDALQTEKLILLSIKDGLPEKIQRQYLPKSLIGKVDSKPRLDYFTEQESIDVINHSQLLLVASIIDFSKGKFTINKLTKLLSEHNISRIDIEQIINTLVQTKSLKQNSDGTFQRLKTNLIADFPDELIEKTKLTSETFFAENYLRFTSNPCRPNALFESFIGVHKSDLQTYLDKLLALRNWTIEADNEKKNRPSTDTKVLLQLNLSFFPAINMDLYNQLLDEKE